MKLTEDYEITVDDRNVILRHYIAPVEKTKKVSDAKDSPRISTGEYTAGHWEVVGFYRTHQAALRAWVNMELREETQEVSELLRKIDGLYELIGGLDINYVYQCNCKKAVVSDESL